MVKLLLATDSVDPDTKDEVGFTPLFGAAHNGHEEVMKLLLDEWHKDSTYSPNYDVMLKDAGDRRR